MDELYDLEVDPSELDGLVGSGRESKLRPAPEAELARLRREPRDLRKVMRILPDRIP